MQSQLAELCTIPIQFSAFDRTRDARFCCVLGLFGSRRSALVVLFSESR